MTCVCVILHYTMIHMYGYIMNSMAPVKITYDIYSTHKVVLYGQKHQKWLKINTNVVVRVYYETLTWCAKPLKHLHHHAKYENDQLNTFWDISMPLGTYINWVMGIIM